MARTRLTAFLLLSSVLVFILAGIPGCSDDSDSPTEPSTITVTGRVVTGSGLAPVANAPVVITGYPATTTDANGNFTVAGVTKPYDVTVVLSTWKMGMTYRGLTRSDPTLIQLFSSPMPANNASVSGTISGGAGYPLPANHTSITAFVSSLVNYSTNPSSTTGAYSMGMGWDGPSSITGTLHALQWEKNSSGMPQAYKGYAAKTGVTLTSGGSFPGQNIALGSVTSGTISGTITSPATMTLGGKYLYLAFSAESPIYLGSEGGTATAFTYTVPNIAGTTLEVYATASGSGGTMGYSKSGIAVGASNVSLILSEPPQLSLPVNNATNVTTATPFSWTPVTSAVYLVLFGMPGGVDPFYVVVSGTPTATIPDLTSLGLGLPKNMMYPWQIYAFGPHASIDAAAGANGIEPVGDYFSGYSSTRTFTTAP